MKHQKRLLIFLFSGVSVYLLLRSIYVPLLHDEIATFFRYIHINEPFPYYSEWSANNHYLNSLLGWITYKLFGSSAISLRLPNLLSFPVFLYFTYLISLRFKSTFLTWGFILTMIFTHNFIEFFGLSRGYGISMALLMGAVYFLQKQLETGKPRYILYVFLFFIFGSYANLTLINSFIIVIGLLVLNVMINRYQPQQILLKLFFIATGGIIPVYLFINLLFRLQAEGELYYGKQDGFYEVSIKTLMKLLSGSTSEVYPFIFTILIVFTILLFARNIFFEIKSKKFSALTDPDYVFIYLLLGNIVAFILENKIFNTNYPEDRTGLFLFPFFTGSLFFVLDKSKIANAYIRLIPALPLLFFPVHFLLNINLSWSSLENQAIPERFYEYIALYGKNSKIPPTIQGYQGRIMRWNYFNFTKGDELNCIHTSGYPQFDGDFQIVEKRDIDLFKKDYAVIDSLEQSQMFLLERKTKLSRKALFSKNGISSKGRVNDEYFEFQRSSLDSLSEATLYFEFEVNLISPDIPFHSWIVISVSSGQNNLARYEMIPFDWYRTDMSKPGKPFRIGHLVHDIPESPVEFVAYIWNIRKAPFILNSSSISIYKLDKKINTND
ncbi:MAG: hypothetical protein R2750_07570 [Bacteroidales bacterium]